MSSIVVCHCNRPDFLRIQLESLFRMCDDLETVTVVNDGASLALREEIRRCCNDYSKVIHLSAPYSLDHSSAPSACSSVLQWAYDYTVRLGIKGQVGFIDSDMFPLRKFTVSEFLPTGKSFSALPQIRGSVDYVWNGIFFVDFNTIISPESLNWSCGVVKGENVDCGGLMHHYLEKHGRDHIHYLRHTSHMSKEQILSLQVCPYKLRDTYDVSYRMEVFENTFLHYGRASNWETQWLSPQDFNKRKTAYMLEWLKINGVIT